MFSWADHGYSVLTRYYRDVAELLDTEFDTIKELTYEFMGDEQQVDTFKVSGHCVVECNGITIERGGHERCVETNLGPDEINSPGLFLCGMLHG